MDFSKFKNNKVLQITAIIALPTILVAGYYGYKYIKRKSDESKEKAELELNREKYKTINSVDEFLEGIKYFNRDESNHFGYDLQLLKNKKEALSKLTLDELKRLYELAKIVQINQKPEEQEEFLKLMHKIYP